MAGPGSWRAAEGQQKDPSRSWLGRGQSLHCLLTTGADLAWFWHATLQPQFSLGALQMVVLMDPMEDPDDILRAHRSREKSYLFDVAFDFTATQVCPSLLFAREGPDNDPYPASTTCSRIHSPGRFPFLKLACACILRVPTTLLHAHTWINTILPSLAQHGSPHPEQGRAGPCWSQSKNLRPCGAGNPAWGALSGAGTLPGIPSHPPPQCSRSTCSASSELWVGTASCEGSCLRCPQLSPIPAKGCNQTSPPRLSAPTLHRPTVWGWWRGLQGQKVLPLGTECACGCLCSAPLVVQAVIPSSPSPSCWQEMVYQATTKSLIEGVISGYNATVFAYGPTGEGKPRPGKDCNVPLSLSLFWDQFPPTHGPIQKLNQGCGCS